MLEWGPTLFLALGSPRLKGFGVATRGGEVGHGRWGARRCGVPSVHLGHLPVKDYQPYAVQRT